MRKNRIKGILLCIVMIILMLSLGIWTASAAEVTSVSGTMSDDLTYIAALDKEFDYPQITTDTGSPAYISWEDGYWDLADGNSVDSSKFTPGEWRYSVPVYIDHSGSPDTLADDVTLTINGITWVLDSVGNDEYQSYAWFYCPKTFTIASDGTLRYERYVSWVIPYNVVGNEIDQIVTYPGVSGGKTPYKFEKVAGPDWINVSEGGTVSGIPDKAGDNDSLIISVTDDNGDSRKISIPVAFTDSKERIPIYYIEGESDLFDNFTEGKTPSAVTLNINNSEDEVISIEAGTPWVRYDDETGGFVAMGSDETFKKNEIYRYRRSFEAAYPDDAVVLYPFVLIDGYLWDLVDGDGISGKYIYETPDLLVGGTIDTVTLSDVPYPVVDKPLPYLGDINVAEKGLEIVEASWCKMSGSTLVPCTDTEFVKKDTEYYVNVVVGAKGSLVLADYPEATVNGKGEPDTVVKDNEYNVYCRVFGKMPVLNECDNYFVVTAGSLNVRDAASTSGRRVGGLKYGDVVYGFGETPGWVLIEYEGSQAWVSRSYIALTYNEETAIPPEKYIVTAGALNVRSTPYDPGDSTNRIGGYKLDDEVLITGKLTDINGTEWLVTEYQSEDGPKLGFMMAKYTQSASAKIEKQSASINIGGAYPHVTLVPYKSAISVGNNVDLTDNDYGDNGDGTYSTTFYPDDASYFLGITAEKVSIPDFWDLSVMDVFNGEDGSITVRIGPKDPVTVTFVDENGDLNGSKVISAGGTVQKPKDPSMEGYDFIGWFSDPELTKEFDFSEAVKEDTTLYPGFLLKSVAPPETERENPATGVTILSPFSALFACVSLFVGIRKKNNR